MYRFSRTNLKSIFFGLVTLTILPSGLKSGRASTIYHDSEVTPAESVIEAAARNRVNFIKTVTEIQRLAPTIVWPEQLYQYILCLDDLEEIGLKHGMDTWGPSPVKELGNALTEQSLKWIRFDKDELNFIETFITWAKDDVIQLAISSHHGYLNEIEGVNDLALWHRRLGSVIKALKKKKTSPYVLESAYQLQAKMITITLETEALHSEELIAEMIETLESQISTEQITAYLFKKTYSTSQANDLERILKLADTLAIAISQHSNEFPSSLLEVPGELTLEIVRKIIYLDQVLDETILTNMICHLHAKHLADFIHLFNDYRWDLLSPDKVQLLNHFSKHLIQQFKHFELKDQEHKLKKLQQRFSTLMALNHLNLEGTYQGQMGDGKGTLTIVSSGGQFTLASLRLSQNIGLDLHHQDFGFTDLFYNEDHQSFELQRILVDDPRYGVPDRNMYQLEFSAERNENAIDNSHSPTQLMGFFTHGGKLLPFTMQKIESFPVYPQAKQHEEIRISGIFTNEDFSLSISRVNEQVAAVLTMNEWNNQVFFNFGRFSAVNRTAYLSSGEQRGGRTVYLRVNFLSEDEIKVTYIIGGQGISMINRSMTRQ